MQPGEKREARVIIDPDPGDIKSGETAEFALTAYIKKMIGGVNFNSKRDTSAFYHVKYELWNTVDSPPCTLKIADWRSLLT
ncbi:MAG: hypothetical protein FP814_05715 [Desulfobacterium sp.]|nr:hypothetical protein [Desulfobacterium sp.]MBU3948736.1 hypothetical protein [Pseudomonadota bacterium]MBU4011052.1 hypothetical protein [Pseudomonadota bacterium]MBU4035709.1 hypothetical protein [Pseudomonadota bacterium]